VWLLKAFKKILRREERHKDKERKIYFSDGSRTNNKNLESLYEPQFLDAWNKTVKGNKLGWTKGVPYIKWTAYVAICAATLPL
jgi:hypothetical protein